MYERPLTELQKVESSARSRRVIGTLASLIAQEEEAGVPSHERQWKWEWELLPKVREYLAQNEAPIILEQCFIIWSADALPPDVVVADRGLTADQVRRSSLVDGAVLEATAIHYALKNADQPIYTNGRDWFVGTDPQTLRHKAERGVDTRPLLLARRLECLLPALKACQALVDGEQVEFFDLRRLP